MGILLACGLSTRWTLTAATMTSPLAPISSTSWQTTNTMIKLQSSDQRKQPGYENDFVYF